MSILRRFGSFWWDFIVGDDWRLALSAACALAITGLVAGRGVSAWWITPFVVTVALAMAIRTTLRRAATPKAEGP